MHVLRKTAPWMGLVTLAALGTTAPAALAQTILTGPHDNNPTGDGFDAYTGSDPDSVYAYRVPADAGSPSATFNGNRDIGFLAPDYDAVSIAGGQFDNNGVDGFTFGRTDTTISGGQFDNNRRNGVSDGGASLQITGGQFDNNNFYGLYVVSQGTATVTGGHFGGNLDGLYTSNATVTIDGGRFSGNTIGAGGYALNNSVVTVKSGDFTNNGVGFEVASNADVILTGGDFSNTRTSFTAEGDANSVGKINLYGQFPGLAVGQTQTLPKGFGSFTGVLQNNAASQTYSYQNQGMITLHAVAAAPEPSEWAVLSFTGLGVAGLILKARRRKASL